MTTPTSPRAGSGARAAGGTTAGCPCPTDFTISAPCKIIKVDGGRVQIRASNPRGVRGGTFAWTTSSTKIRLHNQNSRTVTVEGLANPSASRNAETITVTRTQTGCSPIQKTVNVTVAKVTFSKATTQRFGYDDYDTPADPSDDHVSIKKSDHTFVRVVIEGGAMASDFRFACRPRTICHAVEPNGADTSFDLRLNAMAVRRHRATLRARSRCPHPTTFASIKIHVYKEKKVDVVVAKVYDSTKAGTNLRFPNENYANFTNTANTKLREAVVKYDITNFSSTNATTDVRYDLDGNGAVTYDIARGGGRELAAINRAMRGTGRKTRVAIVRSMKSYYYLSRAASAGSRTLRVTARSVFDYGAGSHALGSGATQENVTVSGHRGNRITLAAPLANNHARGEALEFPAAGWSCNPILIIEGNTSLSTIKWTIVHEVGHNPLRLKDVVDTTNVMNFDQGNTDNRLRYCPRRKKYQSGTENQWQTIRR